MSIRIRLKRSALETFSLHDLRDKPNFTDLSSLEFLPNAESQSIKLRVKSTEKLKLPWSQVYRSTTSQAREKENLKIPWSLAQVHHSTTSEAREKEKLKLTWSQVYHSTTSQVYLELVAS